MAKSRISTDFSLSPVEDNPPLESSQASDEPSALVLDQPGETPPAAPAGEQPRPLDAPAAAPELLTPDQWAERKGLIVQADPRTPWIEPHSKGFHAPAAQLHGWTRHSYNEQNADKAFRLSEADYDAALVAAAEYPALPAHAPALAPDTAVPPIPEHIAKALEAASTPSTEPTSGA